ncbi:MAG: AraC-like DNA-binding protein [Pseudohongiellaceae bacterium]
MDKLSEVLNNFSISAGVFYTGNLCGLSSFNPDGSEEGHIHLLKSAKLTVIDRHDQKSLIDEPSVLFYPRPAQHRLLATQADDAQVICATIKYGTGSKNPLANALSELLTIKLNSAVQLRMTTDLLFQEVFAKESGRLAMMDRLTEIFVIHLLRYAMTNNLVAWGMLSGLSHPQLSKAIIAMHQTPERHWELETLAELSAMWRSKFAELFREKVGQTAGDYLLEWRVALAQNHLKKGRPVDWVANQAGYENASALARVFRKKTGQSPQAEGITKQPANYCLI